MQTAVEEETQTANPAEKMAEIEKELADRADKTRDGLLFAENNVATDLSDLARKGRNVILPEVKAQKPLAELGKPETPAPEEPRAGKEEPGEWVGSHIHIVSVEIGGKDRPREKQAAPVETVESAGEESVKPATEQQETPAPAVEAEQPETEESEERKSKQPNLFLRDIVKEKVGELQEWLKEPILTEQVEYVRDKIGELKKWLEKPIFAPKAWQSENERPLAETVKPATEQQEPPAPEASTKPELSETQTADEQLKSLIEQADKAKKLPWRKYHEAGTILHLYDPISRTDLTGRNFIAALLHKELSNSQDPRFFPKEALKDFGLSVNPEAKPVLLMFKREENGAEVAVTKAYYNAKDIREQDELPPAQKLARREAGTIQAERGKTAIEQFGKDLTAFLIAARTGKGFAPSNRSYPFEAMKEIEADRLAMAAHSADLNQRIAVKTEKEHSLQKQNQRGNQQDMGS
jgi:hypothetical protein